MELMPEMRWAPEMSEERGRRARGRLQQRARLVFGNLMGESFRHQTYCNTLGKTPKRVLEGARKRATKHAGADEIGLGFMIRHVRPQIKSVISGLMNDLANYKRYLKTL